MESQAAVDRIVAQGKDAYGPDWSPEVLASAPGRLELLGNHVDYNGGIVLAGAIDRMVHAVAAPSVSGSTSIRLFAPDVSTDIATVDSSAPAISDAASTTPADYLAGIIMAMQEAGVASLTGLDITVGGDVPVGFGMSSSAALCVSLTMLLAENEQEPAEVVKIARRAEHITGAPVGAMDQSASVAGGVILFDGATSNIRQMSPDLGDHVFAVANSGVHHALGESAYPTRVRESEEALTLIREHTDLSPAHLGSILPDEWGAVDPGSEAWLPSDLRDRVRHVVSEVERVRQGVEAIEAQDWQRFGSLMTASGRSSATIYQISHPVVEELAAELVEHRGVLGARMMGGGEGGPALALLHRDAVAHVREALATSFFERHGLSPEDAFEVCSFGPGAQKRSLS